MSDWFETLGGLQEQVWRTLAEGVAHADHPARYPTFATVSSAGWPEARTVVLRAAQAGAHVDVYTDLHSDKMRSLRANPRAALHVWDETLALQIRLQATVEVLTGAAVQSQWESVPDHGRQSYGTLPRPGTEITTSLAYKKSPDQATFAVLRCHVVAIDAVHLGAVHRRASFSQEDNWAGRWLSP